MCLTTLYNKYIIFAIVTKIKLYYLANCNRGFRFFIYFFFIFFVCLVFKQLVVKPRQTVLWIILKSMGVKNTFFIKFVHQWKLITLVFFIVVFKKINSIYFVWFKYSFFGQSMMWPRNSSKYQPFFLNSYMNWAELWLVLCPKLTFFLKKK